MIPIQIKPGDSGRLIVRVPYSPGHVAKIKTVPGRRWHQGEKCWTIPHTDSALSHLQTLFAGEPVEVELSLRPANASSNREPSHEPVALHAEATHLKLFDQVRQAIRTRHYSYRTEKAYIHWIKRFTLFHNKRHPAEIGEAEIGRFLSRLATDSHVSASTQNQALNALLLLYREVLGKAIGYVNGVVRAKRPARLPVVLTRQEVRAVLARLEGSQWIMGMLLLWSRSPANRMFATQGQGR